MEECIALMGQRLPHYEIVGRLGEGGMGVLYKVRDTHLGRFLAIKVLPPKKMADDGHKLPFREKR